MPLDPLSLLKPVLAPVLRPTVRLLAGFLVIPAMRAIRHRVSPGKKWDDEIEKDVEQWVRGSLVLFLATKNVEEQFTALISEGGLTIDLDKWWIVAGRLLLAIGVIEMMPDQELFTLIHPGPQRLRWAQGKSLTNCVKEQSGGLLKGLACLHLSRSSPVFAILAVIFSGVIGWVFFLLAIIQYLIIGLVTSRDKALDVLSRFDEEIARKRRDLLSEFDLQQPENSINEDLG